MVLNVNRTVAEWGADISLAANAYNDWYLRTCPVLVARVRSEVVELVDCFHRDLLENGAIDTSFIRDRPEYIKILRAMSTPTMATDRLAVLASVANSRVKTMENDNRIPQNMLESEIERLLACLAASRDPELYSDLPSDLDNQASLAVLIDRLQAATFAPALRNAQEPRQAEALVTFLESLGYTDVTGQGVNPLEMNARTFQFRSTILGEHANGGDSRVPVDVVIQVRPQGHLPCCIELKSVGDPTNANKRLNEQEQKAAKLQRRNPGIHCFILIGGHFNESLISRLAANERHFVWEHRISDLESLLTLAN